MGLRVGAWSTECPRTARAPQRSSVLKSKIKTNKQTKTPMTRPKPYSVFYTASQWSTFQTVEVFPVGRTTPATSYKKNGVYILLTLPIV